MLMADGREAAEIIIDTTLGGGEYDIYYLPHTQRWEAYDAREDQHGTRTSRVECLIFSPLARVI